MAKDYLLLKSLKREKIDRYPVWLMRQAGRYMPEYKRLRERYKDFLSFCKDVETAVKVSLLPLEILDVDAIIIFSDILVPLEVLGIEISFVENEGPKLKWDKNPDSLNDFDVSKVDFVFQIIEGVKKAQNLVPVIGFSGAPYTLAAYAIEGSGSKNFRKAKVYMWERKEDFKKLLNIITEALKKYIENQIKAGADVIQIFDSWLDSLPVTDFKDIVKPYIKDLIMHIKSNFNVPVIYFFRGSSAFIEEIEDIPCDAISVDWSVDISVLSKRTNKVIQGNLDPCVLYSSEDVIKEKVLSLLRSVGRDTGYIFNLGHGIAPDMSQEKVKFLVDTVKAFRL